METLATLIFLMIALWFFIIMFILITIHKILVRGEEVNRLSKSLIVSAASLIGARVARKLIKRVL